MQDCAAESIRYNGEGTVMKRIHYALAAAMLCATVSACKREEAPAAPAAEPAAVEAPAMPAPAESMAAPAPVESVGIAAPASVDAADSGDTPHTGGDKVGTTPAPAAAEDDDTPHSGGDKVGG
jgi:hypothetical protein